MKNTFPTQYIYTVLHSQTVKTRGHESFCMIHSSIVMNLNVTLQVWHIEKEKEVQHELPRNADLSAFEGNLCFVNFFEKHKVH